VQSILYQKIFFTLEIIALILVGVALIAEVLPEVKAKIIVVPALILLLILSIIRVRRMGFSRFR
jgi:hypothetical protein